MSSFELPLVFFTVFIQWSAGTALALTLLLHLRPATYAGPENGQRLFRLVAAILLVSLAGSFASTMHLGTPLEAYRAMLGVQRSWLSREGLAVMLFTGTLLAWAATVYVRRDKPELHRLCGLAASIAGVVAVLATGQVYYQMSAHPFWHTPLTYLNFIGMMVLLGSSTASMLLCVGNNTPRPVPGTLTLGIAAGACMMLLALTGYAAGLNQQGPMLASARFLFGSPLFAGFLLLALLLPVVLLLRIMLRPSLSRGLACGFLLLMVGAALCSRMLFYAPVMKQYPWF
ncbi:MAG TPA: DmsC/YnfH family molybdoenzyme membrane anchor subunit [Nitratidesulfovibrio sp.]|nr:DmsC/YnfH family molybdoenzyme membrane anchor subunit [Nitratidesulfovibrio sp.]